MNQFSSLTQKRFMLAKVSRCLVFLFLLLVLFSGSVLAQNTFQVASGNWNNAANWSAAHVPNGTENLVIPAGDVCTMDVNYTNNSVYTLTLSGELDVPGVTLTMQSATLLMNANGAKLSGGGNISLDNLTVNTPGPTDEVSITNSNVTPIAIGVGNSTGTINLTNGILKLTGQTLALPKTTAIVVGTGNFANGSDGILGDVDADGGTLFCATSTPATTTITGAPTFYNVYFNNGNDHFNFDISANAHINGTFTVPNNGNQFNTSGASPIWGTSSTLYYDGGSQNHLLGQSGNLWSSSGPVGTPGYPNNVTITDFGTSGGGGYGWVATNGSVNNIAGVLTIGGIGGASTGIINFSALTNFSSGGFVLESGSKLDAPSTFTVAGSWYDSSSSANYLNNNGTVVFAGSGTQHIGGSVATPFNNITIDSSNGTNILDLAETLPATGVLTMTTGVLQKSILQTTSTNILSVTNPNTTGIVINGTGSLNSYIDGPVKWSMIAGAGTYNVPLGNGGSYLPFTLNKTLAGGATVATIQAFNSAAAASNSVDGTLSSISTTEYWSLSTTTSLAAGSSVSITRPTAIAPFTSIAESNVQAGPYTSKGGTVGTFGITNSNDIGTISPYYFTFGAPPIVSTFNATSITTTSVTLNGGFNTQGSTLATSFNWGTTVAYGSNIASLNTPINSNVNTPDSAHLTGLTANTLYHYQATDGANSGNDVIFITAPNPPIVGVGTAATGSGFTANWTAPAVPGTATYTYRVEVSTDPTFAGIDVVQSNIPSGTLSYTFTTLASGTTYYYRVRAENVTANSVWSANSPAISTSISQTVGSCTTGTGSTTSTGSIVESFTFPVIDGQVDSIWSAIPANNISNISVGGATYPTPPTWKAVWSTDSLYFLIQVTDPTLISQNTTLPNSVAVAGATPGTSNNYYDFDGVELTLDPDYSHGSTYDGLNDVQLRFNLGGLVPSGQSCGCATQFSGTMFNNVYTHIDYKVIVTASGYNVEAAIPWGQNAGNPGINLISAPSTYGTIANGKNIGLEVQVNDANSVGGRNSQYSWFNTSPNPYQNPSTFAEATLTTCILPPQVINPTVTAITATGATLGATVVSSGDALLTGRGTGYTPSPDNSGTGNPLLEGGTSLGVYSGPARTGLTPQTKYYFTGYATNASNETGVSNVDSFFTLSALPTVQASGFSATGCGPLTLNWTAATFPPIGQATETGYLVLRATAPAVPTATGIVTRVAATQGELSPGVTLITTINSGATTTYNDGTAVSGVTYNYLLVPFTWDGVTADSTYNFDTTAAPQTVGSFTSSSTVTLTSASGTDNQSLCAVSTPITTITYSVTGTATGATVTGLPTGVNGVYASGTVTITGSPSVTGVYTYTVTTTGGCGVATANGTISISSPATVNLSSASGTDAQTGCVNTAITSITYNTTGATGATVTGLPTGVNFSYLSGVVTISGTPTTAIGSPFTYTVTTTGGCGSPATANGTITVTPAATVALATGSATQTVCISTPITSITYNVSNATGATVTGLPTGVNGVYASGVVTISGTPTTAIGSPFTYTVTTTGGCGVAIANGTITVTGNATATLSSAVGTDAQEVCVNNALTSITYNVTGATGANVTGLPTGVNGSYAGGVVTISGTPTTTVGSPFSYTVTTTGGCGVATANGSITVNGLPTASVSSSLDTTDGTQLITLTETTPASTYAWSVAPSGSVTTGSSTATATPAVTSTYTVNITDANGCAGSAQQIVVVVPTTCAVPNAFTPNADGFNDLWVVNGGCFFSVDVNVYNRWGSLVYHAENYQNDWDGTYKGKQLPDGTYYYVLTIHPLSGGSYTRTGNVTIMR